MPGEPLGTIAALWRFPVKSLRGEALPRLALGPTGAAGDRAFALRDRGDGRILSAKRSPGLLRLRAGYPAGPGRPAAIALPGGGTVATDAADVSAVLSRVLGREVELCGPDDARADRRVEWDERESFEAPPFAFVDLAPVHLLTTASLAAVAPFHAEGRFDPRRFRPNLLIDSGTRRGFPEDALAGRLLAVGETARLRVFMPTIRCAMTTAAQEELARDPAILRTIVERHEGNLGAYATVEAPGEVRLGDRVAVLDG
jgi:uncharacterized protein YcbX